MIWQTILIRKHSDLDVCLLLPAEKTWSVEGQTTCKWWQDANANSWKQTFHSPLSCTKRPRLCRNCLSSAMNGQSFTSCSKVIHEPNHFQRASGRIFSTNHGHDIGQNKSSNLFKDSKSLRDKSLISKCSPQNTNIINDPPFFHLYRRSAFFPSVTSGAASGGGAGGSWHMDELAPDACVYKEYSISYVNTWSHHSILYIRILI